LPKRWFYPQFSEREFLAHPASDRFGKPAEPLALAAESAWTLVHGLAAGMGFASNPVDFRQVRVVNRAPRVVESILRIA
jgi:hypothetical protein